MEDDEYLEYMFGVVGISMNLKEKLKTKLDIKG